MASHHQETGKIFLLHRGPVALHDIPCDVEPPLDYPIGVHFSDEPDPTLLDRLVGFIQTSWFPLALGFAAGMFATVGMAEIISVFVL